MPLTAEHIEKSRAEFEALFNEFHGFDRLDRFNSGHYKDPFAVCGWKYWIARQETLCVELPFSTDTEIGDMVMEADKVRLAIEAAGIAHK